MAQVIFYEKPGCIANRRQKAVLRASGHELDVRDLLHTGWTPAVLRPFFRNRPVADWINRSAPQVKSGAFVPEALTELEALDALCADPLLIRRPLIECNGQRRCGFDEAEIRAWIGLVQPRAQVDECCPRPDATAGR